MTELVFVDSGVLIAAATGRDRVAEQARRILLVPNLEFASTQLVWLEVVPTAQYTGRLEETRFYKSYFDSVSAWAEVDVHLLEDAARLAARHGLSAVDAEIRVTTIQPDAVSPGSGRRSRRATKSMSRLTVRPFA